MHQKAIVNILETHEKKNSLTLPPKEKKTKNKISANKQTKPKNNQKIYRRSKWKFENRKVPQQNGKLSGRTQKNVSGKNKNQ